MAAHPIPGMDKLVALFEQLTRRLLGKRGALVWIVLIVLLPLSALLTFQYFWLKQLEASGDITRKLRMESDLDLISEKIAFAYRKGSNHFLDIPPALLRQPPAAVEKYVAESARMAVMNGIPDDLFSFIFLQSFSGGPLADPGFFQPTNGQRVTGGLPEHLAEEVFKAGLQWELLTDKTGSIRGRDFTVVQGNRGTTLVMAPLTSEQGDLLGMAGGVIVHRHFLSSTLPSMLRYLEFHLPGSVSVQMAVRDEAGAQVFGEGISDEKLQVAQPFRFVMTDWELVMAIGPSAPSKFLRRNFWFNMSLSVVLAGFLFFAIVIVLAAASRTFRLSEMKSDFVSNVSHELRTPVASIRVFGELLRSGRVKREEKVREYGEYIETEARRLSRLINNILDFSKIESGKKIYEFKLQDLEELVISTVETFRLRLRNERVNITYEPPNDPIPDMMLDAGAIGQAFYNLLDNAVKYGDGKDILVRLRWQEQQPSNLAILDVCDSGIGIDKREQDKIFERFHRVDNSLVHDVKGCGLGLAIVKHIVAAHGGNLALESQLGIGSRFSIRIPILEEAEQLERLTGWHPERKEQTIES